MRRIPLLLLILSCAFAADASAQTPSSARRDSIRMAEVEAEEADTAAIPVDEEEAAADTTVPEPVIGPYARSGGAGPFSVQASGQVAPRPDRGEVVWVNAAPRPAADSARRDTARAGTTTRVTSGASARRDSASAARPAARDTARSGSRVSSASTTRRDSASAARPTARDTARTGSRVSSGSTTRRDTASATRPAGRDTARTGSRVSSSATRRDTSASTSEQRPGTTTTTRPGAAAPAGRARSHTVVAGETFYGIARRYTVTAAQLRALNPDVDMDALEVGDVLRLPAGARDSRAPAQPRPQAPAATGGQTTTQPRRGTRSHVVAAGETLFGIARRYGVTVDAIRRANQLETDQVRTGQRIVIPPAS